MIDMRTHMTEHCRSQNLAQLPRLNNLLRFQDRWVLACLQAHHGPDTLFFSQGRQFFCFFLVASQRPFAKNIFSRFQSRTDEIIVLGHVDANSNDVYVGILGD